MTTLEMDSIAPTIDLEVQEVMEGNGGASDYGKLNNKPSINGVELIGDKTLGELGIHEITNSEIEEIIENIGGL